MSVKVHACLSRESLNLLVASRVCTLHLGIMQVRQKTRERQNPLQIHAACLLYKLYAPIFALLLLIGDAVDRNQFGVSFSAHAQA